MKKIIPFKKDIIFKNNLSEITSISLEHSLHIANNNLITGEFIISGDYRMTDSSINTDEFHYNLPFDIDMDDRYILDDVEIDIDDFYYEIKNNNILSINIEVLIDKIEEKLQEKIIIREQILDERDDKEVQSFNKSECLDNELVRTKSKSEEVNKNITDNVIEKEENNEIGIKTLFDNIDENSETYVTYYVYIVRENDTAETILKKYNISKEDLELYNDINELKIGDKIIIPSLNA